MMHSCVCIHVPYSGFFRGGKFSRIALIQLFEGENFHESRQEHTVPNAFSKNISRVKFSQMATDL